MALSAQPLPDGLQQAVNQARQKAGEFYQFTEDETPLLIQSQDGTASGKTFSVFYQYLRAVNPAVQPGQGHRNLVFITPLKSQIDLPAQIIELAERNQINQAPHKAIRVYKLVAKDFSGQAVDALNTAAAQLLLRTYTLDLLRYKEVTQSSLLEKIARMALEN